MQAYIKIIHEILQEYNKNTVTYFKQVKYALRSMHLQCIKSRSKLVKSLTFVLY